MCEQPVPVAEWAVFAGGNMMKTFRFAASLEAQIRQETEAMMAQAPAELQAWWPPSASSRPSSSF
jgi:hypothetical protein